jgi:hypothetical protein
MMYVTSLRRIFIFKLWFPKSNWLTVFETCVINFDRLLRRIFGSYSNNLGTEKTCIMESFIICIPHQILFG